MSVERKALSALKWAAAGRLAGQTVSWIVTLVVLRLLSPTDYGLMAMVTVVIAISAAIADFGIGASIVQARALERSELQRLAGFVLVVHVALALLIVAGAPLAADFFNDQRLTLLIRASALQFVFAALGAVPEAMARRALSFKWLATVELASTIAMSLCTLALAWLGHGVWALVGGALIGAAFRSALLVARGDNVVPSFRLFGIASHLDYGWRAAASHILWSVIGQADAMIGGRLLPRDALGSYAVALQLAMLPMHKIMGVINPVAFTAVARLQDETQRLRLRLLLAARLVCGVSVPLLWGLGAVAPEVVLVVLGEKWSAVIIPLQLISLIVPLRMLGALLTTAIAATGRADLVLRNTLIVAAIWPACFVVGAQWGAQGLAASWLVAAPASFAVNVPAMSRALGLRFMQVIEPIGPTLLSGVAMIGGVAALRWAMGEASVWLVAPILIGAGAAVYLALIALLDRGLLHELRRLVSDRRAA